MNWFRAVLKSKNDTDSVILVSSAMYICANIFLIILKMFVHVSKLILFLVDMV